jgi:hypothetical protein
MKVSLFYAPIPWLGWLAVHGWFEVEHQGQIDRWEVWHRQNRNQTSWGYLHKNLFNPQQWPHRGKIIYSHSWHHQQARRIATQLANSSKDYPYRNFYRFWPGPNSNTFVQIILLKSQIHYPLCRKALGKNYPAADKPTLNYKLIKKNISKNSLKL